MNGKDKLSAALKVQQKIEGFTPETGLLLKVLPLIKMQSEWLTLTKTKHIKDDSKTWEFKRFYYPSPLLTSLEQLFTDKPTKEETNQ